jgi:hypothetical protein
MVFACMELKTTALVSDDVHEVTVLSVLAQLNLLVSEASNNKAIDGKITSCGIVKNVLDNDKLPDRKLVKVKLLLPPP